MFHNRLEAALHNLTPPTKQPTHRESVSANPTKPLDIKFKPATTSRSYKTVTINVAKVDRDLAQDSNMYVGPGGAGGISGRYQGFRKFLASAIENHTPINQPRMSISDATGNIMVGDGRHRFAVLRDIGIKHLPISVPTREAQTIQLRYG